MKQPFKASSYYEFHVETCKKLSKRKKKKLSFRHFITLKQLHLRSNKLDKAHFYLKVW